MDYEIDFGGFPADVTISVSGVARIDAFAELFGELTDAPEFVPGMRILLDLTRVDMTSLPGVDAAEIGGCIAKLQDRCEGCSVAVVCDDPLTRTLIGMAELGSSSGIDVFRALSREEAAGWLRLARAVTDQPHG